MAAAVAAAMAAAAANTANAEPNANDSPNVNTIADTTTNATVSVSTSAASTTTNTNAAPANTTIVTNITTAIPTTAPTTTTASTTNTNAAPATTATPTVTTAASKDSINGIKTKASSIKVPGSRMHAVTVFLTAGTMPADTSVASSPLVNSAGTYKSGVASKRDSSDKSVSGEPVGGSPAKQAATQGVTGVEAKQRIEAEHRRAALAAIENRRSRPPVPDDNSMGTSTTRFSGDGGEDIVPPVSSVASSSTVPSFAANLKLSAAFSAQSVRLGAILGYYGREEVKTLFAISKNPSRIAAYNRIIKGKRGGGRDDDDVEVRE